MSDPTMDPSGFGYEPSRPRRPDRRRDVRLVVSGVVGVLLIWFAIANLQDVTIHFWVSSSRAPLIVVVVISALLGMLAGGLITRSRRNRHDDGQTPDGMPGPGY